MAITEGRGPRGRRPPPLRPVGYRSAGCGPWVAILLTTAVAAFLVLTIGSRQLINFFWFQALNFDSVFSTTLTARLALFFGGAIITFLFFAINLSIARRFGGPQLPSYIPREELVGTGSGLNWVIGLTAGAVAGLVGLVMATEWNTVLLAFNPTPFGVTDPLYHQDISFYVFTLPFIRLVHTAFISLVVVTLIGVIAAYAILLSGEGFRAALSKPVLGHISALAAILLLAFSLGYWFDRYDLLFNAGRAVYGAGYTDVHVRLPALTVLTGIAALSAVVLLANVWLRRIWLVASAAGIWLVAAVVLGTIWPGVIQRFVVEPSELSNETPYLENNITYTRLAYALDRVEEQPFTVTDNLTAAEVQANSATISNLRLWDYRPLQDTLNQIQTIRLYYEFPDVDIDRYVINGQYRQVMLGVRELAQDRLAQQAQTWVAQHLQFTHGYGIAMSPVNEVSNEGLPSFFVRDVPPVGDIKITQPGVYYGERTENYVIVDSTSPTLEFDYPQGEDNVSTQYSGAGGVLLDSMFRRLLFALRFGDGNILLSQYIGPQSRILFNRNVADRVQQLAPFLTLDSDPYMVVDNGRLVWMIDAYTTTDHYPYSEPIHRPEGTFNYIRNSVKATIDAYNGNVTFYVADSSDPIIASYQRIFPGMFHPMSDMSPTLAAHRRYPEMIFSVQAEMYRTYHMTDPQVFYNREDLWAIPRDIYGQGNPPMEPYYVIMRLPGQAAEEFALILPFTPNRRDNMISWLAARSDGDNYGRLMAIRFPKDRLIFGPAQIGARINQDPAISSQMSLWNQQGSRVIRGNLLVIPIEDALLYVEPVYLQAERSQLPELKRIILATANNVVMEPTLNQALAQLFNLTPQPQPGGQQPGSPTPPTSDIVALIQSAQNHYNSAQERLKAGDFAGYGEQMKLLEADLQRLGDLAGAK